METKITLVLLIFIATINGIFADQEYRNPKIYYQEEKDVHYEYQTTPATASTYNKYHEIQYENTKPNYEFKYAVNDEKTGDIKSHYEIRDGDNVKGMYTLLDADGYKRIVEYTADKKDGFKAIVRREPIHPYNQQHSNYIRDHESDNHVYKPTVPTVEKYAPIEKYENDLTESNKYRNNYATAAPMYVTDAGIKYVKDPEMKYALDPENKYMTAVPEYKYVRNASEYKYTTSAPAYKYVNEFSKHKETAEAPKYKIEAPYSKIPQNVRFAYVQDPEMKYASHPENRYVTAVPEYKYIRNVSEIKYATAAPAYKYVNEFFKYKETDEAPRYKIEAPHSKIPQNVYFTESPHYKYSTETPIYQYITEAPQYKYVTQNPMSQYVTLPYRYVTAESIERKPQIVTNSYNYYGTPKVQDFKPSQEYNHNYSNQGFTYGH